MLSLYVMVEFFLLLLLSIPLLLIRIGEGVRSVANLIGGAFIATLGLIVWPVKYLSQKITTKHTPTIHLKNEIEKAETKTKQVQSHLFLIHILQHIVALFLIGIPFLIKIKETITTFFWLVWIILKLGFSSLWVIAKYLYSSLYKITTAPIPQLKFPIISFPHIPIPVISFPYSP